MPTCKELGNHHSHPHNKRRSEQTKNQRLSWTHQRIKVLGLTASLKSGDTGQSGGPQPRPVCPEQQPLRALNWQAHSSGNVKTCWRLGMDGRDWWWGAPGAAAQGDLHPLMDIKWRKPADFHGRSCRKSPLAMARRGENPLLRSVPSVFSVMSSYSQVTKNSPVLSHRGEGQTPTFSQC